MTILDQDWCDDRLKQLRIGSEGEDLEYGFIVFPRSDILQIFMKLGSFSNYRVYCVAYNETYKTLFYIRHDNDYEQVIDI